MSAVLWIYFFFFLQAQKRLDEEIKKLHALCTELSVDDTPLQKWISDVQGWPCGNI